MIFRKIFRIFLLFSFVVTTVMPMPMAVASPLLGLPKPGAMVNLSPAYQPAIIRGLTVYKDNPFLFDFIVDAGQDNLQGEALKKESERLVKYFLASLAVPTKDLWVNLSPYEKGKIVPEALGQTDLGQDLLAQDYILKQITASLIYPEKELGKKFWDKVYAQVQTKYGTHVNIPVNTFNKVWIMADKAEVFERGQTAFVTKSHLKVMLEEDYLASTKHGAAKPAAVSPSAGMNTTQQIIRDIVLPQIEQEVNEGHNFAILRQIFNAIILAGWYKNNLKNALLNQTYSNRNKVQGIDLDDTTTKDQIYDRYVQAYKKGVFNYIKEDGVSDGSTPRKYFSGGMTAVVGPAAHPDMAMLSDMTQAVKGYGKLNKIRIALDTVQGTGKNIASDAAMAVSMGTTDFWERMKHLRLPSHSSPADIIKVLGSTQRSIEEITGYWEKKLQQPYTYTFQKQEDQQKLDQLRWQQRIIEKVLPVWEEIKIKQKRFSPGYTMNQIYSAIEASFPDHRNDLIAAYFSFTNGDMSFKDLFVFLKSKNIDVPLILQNYKGVEDMLANGIGELVSFGIDFKDVMRLMGSYFEPLNISETQEDRNVAFVFEVTEVFEKAGFKHPYEVAVYIANTIGLDVGPAFTDASNEAMLADDEKKAEWINKEMNTIGFAIALGSVRQRRTELREIFSRASVFVSEDPAEVERNKKLKGRAEELLRTLERRNYFLDEAMTATKGGIDLMNTDKDTRVSKEGEGVIMSVDPAMLERMKREGIEGLAPRIINITPVSSIWPMLGSSPRG